MAAFSTRRTLLLLSLIIVVSPAAAHAQAAQPAPSGATAVWTLKVKGDVRWQQVTPAGALLVSTDAALAAVDIDRGLVAWEKPELGGLPADDVAGMLFLQTAPGTLVGYRL